MLKVYNLIFRWNKMCLHVCVCMMLAQTKIPNCSCHIQMRWQHSLSVPLRPDWWGDNSHCRMTIWGCGGSVCCTQSVSSRLHGDDSQRGGGWEDDRNEREGVRDKIDTVTREGRRRGEDGEWVKVRTSTWRVLTCLRLHVDIKDMS